MIFVDIVNVDTMVMFFVLNFFGELDVKKSRLLTEFYN